MQVPATYYPRESPVHRADARVKLALLLVYTVCLFLASTWRALGVLALLLALLLWRSRLPLGVMARSLIPIYVLMAFAVAFNSFTFDPAALATAYGVGGVSAGVWADAEPILLMGSLYLVPAGLVRSLFYCVRVVALVLASLMLAYSTPATKLTGALAWVLRPLARLRVPVDDIALTLTLALRFIPLAFEELQQVKLAQMARGATFGAGGLWRRVSAWQPVMIPWLVGLFRRAGRIATAMDVRAYGLANASTGAGDTSVNTLRTTLNPLFMRSADWAFLACGLVCCTAPCLLFA